MCIMKYIYLALVLCLQHRFTSTATVEPRFCPSENRTAEVLEAAINTPAPESLIEHTNEFVPAQYIQVCGLFGSV